MVQSKPRLARALGEDALDELTDPILGTNYDGVDMRRLIACAAAAVRSTARTRPRMGQVRWLTLARSRPSRSPADFCSELTLTV